MSTPPPTAPASWWRHVILRHALAMGLWMGIGIPLLNGLLLAPPDYDLPGQLLFSIPFFVLTWGLYGAYSWRRRDQGKTATPDARS